jgi:NADPH-dependent ferric siderophore reductase
VEESRPASAPGPAVPGFCAVTVSRVTELTPHLVRVTLVGDDLANLATEGPAAQVKLLFPAPGEDSPTLPVAGPAGLAWPAGRPLPVLRTYTPRRFDPVARELDIDFVLHDRGGTASSWARRARPGDRMVVAAGRGRYQPDPAADWHLVAGDETALPAIATIVAALPAGTGAMVFVEVAGPDERLALESPADLHMTWLYRDGAAPGEALELALRRADLPAGDGRVFVAAEAGAVRRIRRHLLAERALGKEQLYTRGYWTAGSQLGTPG